MDDRPIGMFDSGFGGLTVARAVIDLLPNEHLVYLGDTGRYPYGPRTQDEVREFSLQIGHDLVRRFDVKYLVVACNTATAAAIDQLRAELDIPVMGVIEPGVRALTSATRSGRVGVIATVGTVESGAYDREVARSAPGLELVSVACPGFVELVEEGAMTGPRAEGLIRDRLASLADAEVDALLLGCTHYPFLARLITDAIGREVVLVSSADETAFALSADLVSDRRRNPSDGDRGTQQFLSSGDIRAFEELGGRLLGPELIEAESWTPSW